MGLTVRRAVAADAATVLSLIRGLAEFERLPPPDEAAQERLIVDMFGERPRLDAFLAEIGGLPVGYALVLETYSSFLARPTLYLEDIFVLPDYRGQHAGAALFRKVQEEAVRRGSGRIEWSVLDWNTSAQGFYRSLGARPLEGWQAWRITL